MNELLIVAGFLSGFLSGLWVYAHIYQHFMAVAERKAALRAQAAINAERAGRLKVDEVRKRIVSQYGPDLSERHQEVLNEEVERVLSGGPR